MKELNRLLDLIIILQVSVIGIAIFIKLGISILGFDSYLGERALRPYIKTTEISPDGWSTVSYETRSSIKWICIHLIFRALLLCIYLGLSLLIGSSITYSLLILLLIHFLSLPGVWLYIHYFKECKKVLIFNSK